MIEKNGMSSHYLHIDLTNRSWYVTRLTRRDQHRFLGGKGVGLKLYHDHMSDLSRIEPLSPENLLCFIMSPLLASGGPCSALFEGVSRSPQTGFMASSSCGGPFGYACKTAGWDGVLIEGRSETPVTLLIHYEGVEFIDAREQWGCTTRETQQQLKLGPKEGALVIGPAGEHCVPYASICSGDRYLSRGGLGAVMGSKNLKAVVARGRDYRIEPEMGRKFKQTVGRALRALERDTITARLRACGTNSQMRISMEEGYAPVNNFQGRTDPRIEHLAGEVLSRRYRQTYSTCRHCAVLCGHKGRYPDGVTRQIPEYDTMSMFGPNIGNYNPDVIGQWNDLLNDLGLDPISTGGTIAWAMEAADRGLFSSDLAFGRPEQISAVIRLIAHREGIGDELARGTRWLSEKYGGTEFAVQVKGMELPGYDPRGSWDRGLACAVNGGGFSGAFLEGIQVSADLSRISSLRAKAVWTVFFENIASGVDSLQSCQLLSYSVLLEHPKVRLCSVPVLLSLMNRFPQAAKKLLDWGIYSDLFSSLTGLSLTRKEFLEAGERIHVLERWMNVQMGLTAEADTLPQRFLRDEVYHGEQMTPVELEPLLKVYYELRGYDENGIPQPATLQRLGLAD